jgi:hypothetical protein
VSAMPGAPVASHLTSFGYSWAVFTYGTIPVATMILTVISIILYSREIVAARYGLVSSLVLLAAWCAATAVWFQCDLMLETGCKYLHTLWRS